MKVRSGFVSNSSSSSFLVAFPRNPKSAEDVKKMVFGNDTIFPHPYPDICRISSYPAEQIADIIWECMRKQIPNNKKVIRSKIFNLTVDNWDKYKLYKKDCKGPGDYEFDHEQMAHDNNKIIDDFMDQNTGCFFYTFMFGDDTSIGSAMEHGELFKRLQHLTSSNH